MLRKGRKKQLSAWSIMNINNFKGKVRIKFVFTFYFMSFWPVQLTVVLGYSKFEIIWSCCNSSYSVSKWKSFVFGRFFVNLLPGKSKKVNLPIFAALNMRYSFDMYIYIYIYIYISKLSWLRIWCSSKKFGHEINLKERIFVLLVYTTY